ncbi:hypothetical protein F4824DRAFT_450451 [Ustulina deusta]|nr:hypothetical protein F4824DRAFT_450451 [Ustulina deusta]
MPEIHERCHPLPRPRPRSSPSSRCARPTPPASSSSRPFAQRTGDREVLSKPDLEVLALTYEPGCERNGGDWRCDVYRERVQTPMSHSSPVWGR